MILKRKVENKGRINIPIDALKQANIKPGEEVYIDVIGTKIVIWSKEIE